MCKHPPGWHDRDNERTYVPAAPKTPDAENYVIEDVEWVGGNRLVAKVRYPNCADCAYEGVKVMVFLNVTVREAMRWKRIDPHFRADSKRPGTLATPATHAPSPAARFPGTTEGWQDAIAWAKAKSVVA